MSRNKVRKLPENQKKDRAKLKPEDLGSGLAAEAAKGLTSREARIQKALADAGA